MENPGVGKNTLLLQRSVCRGVTMSGPGGYRLHRRITILSRPSIAPKTLQQSLVPGAARVKARGMIRVTRCRGVDAAVNAIASIARRSLPRVRRTRQGAPATLASDEWRYLIVNASGAHTGFGFATETRLSNSSTRTGPLLLRDAPRVRFANDLPLASRETVQEMGGFSCMEPFGSSRLAEIFCAGPDFLLVAASGIDR
jgi:hypothetical protein